MFGRKERDEYEEYNERQNAKYDDDYIATSEEYREECTHSHEQTYEDYDYRTADSEYREECTHSHEQTYEDFNPELAPYENDSKLEQFFAKKLQNGEHLIWCGETERKATTNEKGTGCSGCAIGGFMAFAAIMMMVSVVFSLMMLMLSAYFLVMLNASGNKYAITDSRIIICKGSMIRSYPLETAGNFSCHASPRNIGYVRFTVTAAKSGSQYATAGIFGIRDPENVKRILIEAKSNSRRFR
ncbi:MAG: hypothetical protein IKO47_03800 [Ruminococcus sp.]|nr:hypothetical protein [Ruminococcus sp.]